MLHVCDVCGLVIYEFIRLMCVFAGVILYHVLQGGSYKPRFVFSESGPYPEKKSVAS